MSWIDSTQYDEKEPCPICHEKYGKTKGIYRASCGHIFHNDCLNDYCDHLNGVIVCPLCRKDVGNLCIDVWAFKEKALSNNSGEPLFNGNKEILNAYNGTHKGGKKHKKVKNTKRRRVGRRIKIKRTYRK
jgi:hypothetical protein